MWCEIVGYLPTRGITLVAAISHRPPPESMIIPVLESHPSTQRESSYPDTLSLHWAEPAVLAHVSRAPPERQVVLVGADLHADVTVVSRA